MTHILIFIHWFVLVFTFGNVELVTIDNSKSNDFPIEELNNHTLREVFETYNIFFNTPIIYQSNGFIDIVDNQITYTQTVDGLGRFGWVVDNYFNDNKYFLNIDVISSNVDLFTFNLRSDNLSNNRELLVDNLHTFTNYNSYITPVYIGDFIQSFGFNVIGETSNQIVFTNYYFIETDSLGISHLTSERIRYWFNIYQENSELEISETYDYIENELTTNDLIYIVLFTLLWGLAIKIVKGVF